MTAPSAGYSMELPGLQKRVSFGKIKTRNILFYAYYPHSGSKAESKENIKMPSLDSQNGTWENIDQYDFLVASRKLSYDTDLGNVAFFGRLFI